MIFLIDDDKYGQMSANYKTDFKLALQSFSEHAKWLQTIPTIDIEILLSKTSCILIHDSIDPKDDKEKLIALVKKLGIPYCIFSNGFVATIFDGVSIKEIKKDRLYDNLLIFITHFKTEGKIDLRLLSLGHNYEMEKASVIQDRLINGTLLVNKNNFNYEVAFPSGSSSYKDLMELVYLSDPSTDFSSFEDKYNSQIYSAQNMRDIIIEMVKKVKKRYE